MNNIDRQTATSISFSQAIATTQFLMNQRATENLSEEEIENKVTVLLNSKQGVRGFFVAYLTSDLPLADNPSVGVINALQSSPNLVGEILVKNIAMSTAMAVTHRRNNDQENAQNSERVYRRSANLIKQLNLDSVTVELTKLQTTLKAEEGSYQKFLHKWGYDAEQKEMIGKAIAEIFCLLN